MGFVLEPAHGFEAVAEVFLGDEPAVREDDHVLGHAADDFGGELFVGRIVGGVPVAGFDILTLGVDVFVLGFVAHIGGAEVEAAPGKGFVIDAEAMFGIGRERFCEGENEFLAGILVTEEFTTGAHLGDAKIFAMEDEFVAGAGQGFEGDCGGAYDGFLKPEGSYIESKMENIDVAFGSVLPVGGRVGWRTAERADANEFVRGKRKSERDQREAERDSNEHAAFMLWKIEGRKKNLQKTEDLPCSLGFCFTTTAEVIRGLANEVRNANVSRRT